MSVAFLVAGLALIGIGLLVLYGPKIPLFGKLPGDIRIEREGFKLYFPITTSLAVSVILSLIFYFLRKIK